jgi:hypothetical protein
LPLDILGCSSSGIPWPWLSKATNLNCNHHSKLCKV